MAFLAITRFRPRIEPIAFLTPNGCETFYAANVGEHNITRHNRFFYIWLVRYIYFVIKIITFRSLEDEIAQDEWEYNEERDDRNQYNDYEHQEGGETVIDEGEENLFLPTAPVNEPCQEDDDFLAALDKMVNDSIVENKNVVRDKNSIANLTVPTGLKSSKKTYDQIQEEEKMAEAEKEEERGKVQVNGIFCFCFLYN